MPKDLESTSVQESPNDTYIPRGDIHAEGMGLISLLMGAGFIIYGIGIGANKIYKGIKRKLTNS